MNMNPMPKLTMDIKRVWAMEHTRDYNKELMTSYTLGIS
jgi:hypothetical protein